MTEKMFRIVSVLNESIEMMLKCLRNRGVISFLPPPGGPMADTSNWSTSFRIDVSFLEAKRAIRYKAITFGCDGATRRGTGSSRRGANALRVHGKRSLFWRCAWDPWDYGLSDAFTSSYGLCGPLFTSVIELKNLDFLAMLPSFAKGLLRNHTYTGKVTAKKTESLLSLVGIYFQRRMWPCTLFWSALWIWKANVSIMSHRLWLGSLSSGKVFRWKYLPVKPVSMINPLP